MTMGNKTLGMHGNRFVANILSDEEGNIKGAICNSVGITSKTSMCCVAEMSIEVGMLNNLAPIRFTLTSALCFQSEQSQLTQLPN